MDERPNYYAIIPANVRYDENLKANEKLMYGEITSLSNKTGICYASNNYFARLYKTTPQAISKWILNLKQQGYINIDYEYNGKEITKRVIKVSINIDRYQQIDDRGINICLEGYQQMFKENNTSINNNNKKEIYKERFAKPTIEQVQEYCKERNNNVDAERFINFYESKGWMIGKNKMKDWKACVRTWEQKNKQEEQELPDWFDNPPKKEVLSDERERELQELIRGY